MRPKALSGSIAKYSRGLALSALTLIGAPAVSQAVDYYWNTGTATWATTTWSDNATTGGTTGVLPTSSDTITFNQSSVNGAETISLGADRSVLGITFSNTGTTLLQAGGTNRILTIGTSGITINSGAGAVTIGSVTANQNVAVTVNGTQSWANNSATTFTVVNAVTGAANTLTLDGTGNGLTTLTGGLTFSGAGGLIIGKAGALGTTISGGTITLGGTGGIVINSGASAVGLGANTVSANQSWTNNSATTFTVSGATAAGATTLTLNGAGDGLTTLTGGLTFSGAGGLIIGKAGALGTTISGGTITLGGTGGIVINSGASAVSLGANTVSANQSWTNNSATTFTVSGSTGVSTGVTLTLGGTGAGLTTLTGGLTTTGTAGLIIGKSGALGTTISGTITLTGTGGIVINSGASAVGLGANTVSASQSWTNNSATTFTVSGSTGVSTATTLTLNGTGAGLTTLTGGLTTTGTAGLVIGKSGALGTTISGGTITLTGSGGITINSGASAVSLGAATLGVAQTWTNNSSSLFTVSGDITNSTFGLTIAGSGNTTASGVLGLGLGSGGLTKNNAGILTLTAVNLYTGTTTVNGGTLTLNRLTGSLIGTNALTFGGSGTFNMDNTSAGVDLAQSLGTLTFSAGDGTVKITRTAAFDQAITFASLAARATGATGNFVTGGTPSATNGIVLTSTTNAPLGGSGPNNRGFFFGGSEYARYDAGGYFRATDYTGVTDTNASSVGTGTTIGTVDATKDVKITGAITAQTVAAVNTINLGANNFTIASGILSVNGLLSSGASAATFSGGTIQTTATGELVIRVDGSSDQLTVSSTIQNNGTTSLTKSGAGTLVLGGTNTYSGVTYVNAGTLRISASANLGSGTLNLNGATLRTTGTLTLARPIVISNGVTFNTDAGTTLTIDTQTSGNVMSGTGGLTKTGAGTMSFISGLFGTAGFRNTFTGGLTVNGGALTVSNAQTIDGANANGSDGYINTSNSLTLGGASATFVGTSVRSTNQTLSGLILSSGDNAVVSTNGGSNANFALNLNGITRSALSTLNVQVGGSNVSTATTTTANTNGILGPWATFGTGSSTRYATGAGTIAGLTGTTAADGSNLGNAPTTNYALTTFGGTVPATVSANTIRYSGAAGTTAPGATLFQVNGLLNTGTGTWTIGSGAVTIGSTNELVVNTASAGITLSAPIIGGSSTAIIKTNANTLTLSGDSSATYSGTTYLYNGTLSLGHAGALGTGSLVIGNLDSTATLSLDSAVANLVNTNTNAQTWKTDFTFVGTNSLDLGAGAVTLTSNRLVAINANTLTVGPIAGSGFGLTKTGNGILALSGANTYSGNTTVTDGGLSLKYGTATSKLSDTGVLSLTRVAVTLDGTASHAEVVGSTTLNAGASSLVQSGGALATLQMNTIARNVVGGTINFGADSIASTDTFNTNGTLGGWATVGQNTWAVSASSGTDIAITGLATYYTTTTGGNTAGNYTNLNVDVTSSPPTMSAAVTPNSLRFNTAAAYTVGLTGVNSIGSGGILVTSTVGNNASTITGGTSLTSGNGQDLVVHQYNTANTLTIATPITGAIGLTKTGPGTLILGGASNYSGQTYVNGGTLQISAANNIGNSSNNGGTLNLNNATLRTTGSLTFNGTIAISNGATLNVDAGTTLTFASTSPNNGIISGIGGLTKNGAGNIAITPNYNTFTGGLTLNGGTFSVTIPDTINNVNINTGGTSGFFGFGNVLTLGGATFSITGNTNRSGQSQYFAGLVLTSGDNSTVSTNSVMTLFLNGITRSGGSTLNISGTGATNTTNPNTNSILGPWATIGAGASTRYATGGGTIAGFSPGTTGTIPGMSDTTGALNYDLTATANATAVNSFSANTVRYSGSGVTISSSATGGMKLNGILNVGTGTLTIAAPTLTESLMAGNTNELVVNTANAAVNISAPIINNGGTPGTVIKVGAFNLTLGGANTYTGGTYFYNGTLTLGSTTALGTGPLVIGTPASTGTFSLDSSVANLVNANTNVQTWNADLTFIGTNSLDLGPGAVTVGKFANNSSTNNFTVTVNANTLKVGGAVSASGYSLTKAGLGTLVLSGSVNSGAGTPLTITGGTVNFQQAAASSQSMGALTFSALDGTVQSTFNATSATLSFSSLAARPVGVTGNFVLSGGTAGTPGTPSGGVLGTNNIVLTGVTPSQLIDRGFFYNGSAYAAYDAAGFVRGVAYGTDTNAPAAIATAATIVVNDATKNVKITGAITAQTNASVNTINLGANNFTITAGQLLSVNGLLSSGGSAAKFSTGTIQPTATGELLIRVDGSSDQLTVSSTIQNNGSTRLTKSGAGALILAATPTYTGNTVINAGTLAVASSWSPANNISGPGSLVVQDGATLTLYGGTANTFTGGVTVIGSTLTLNFPGNAGNFSNPIAPGNALTLNSAILNGAGNDNGVMTQTFSGATLSGANLVTVRDGGGATDNMTIALNALIRNAGGVIAFQISHLGGTVPSISTTTGNTNNILGPWATIGTGTTTRYATGAGTIASFTGTTAATIGVMTDTTGALNYDLTATANATAVSNFSANTVRYSGSGVTLSSNTTGGMKLNGILNAGTGTLTIAQTSSESLMAGNTNELIVNTANAAVNISAPIINNGGTAGTLTKTGSNNLTLSGTNTYTGGTFLNTGTLTLGSTTALGTGTLIIGARPDTTTALDSSVANLVNANNNFQNWNGNFTFTGTNNLDLGNGQVTLGNGAVTLGAVATRTVTVFKNTLTVRGAIGDGGYGYSLVKAGLGTLALLDGTKTYTGATTVNAGTLLWGGTSNLSASAPLTVAAFGNFSLADGTARSTSTAALILAANSNLTFDWNGADMDALTSTAAATTVAGNVLISINPSNTPTSGGPLTLISAPSGGLNNATYLTANNTNFIATLTKSSTALTITSYATVSPLTTAYWKGGGAGLGSAMALSLGTISNWDKDTLGTTAGGVVPGASADVVFSTTGATQQSSVTLGADMTVKSLTFNDSSAVTLTGPGTLTLTSASTTPATTTAARAAVTPGSAISVTQFSAEPTIRANMFLGTSQTWDIATGKTLLHETGSGSASNLISGAGVLTKTGNGKLLLRWGNIGAADNNTFVPHTFTGGVVVNGGTLQITTLSNNNTSLKTDFINSANSLTLAGGTYSQYPGGDNHAVKQTFNGLTLNAGENAIVLSIASGASSDSDLAIAAIIRNPGSTLSIPTFTFGVASANPANITIGTSTPNAGSTGILGPWAFWGSGSTTQYARNTGSATGTIAGNNIGPAGVGTGMTAAGTIGTMTDTTGAANYDLTATTTSTARNNFSANTVRYSGSGLTVNSNVTGGLTLNGILNVGTGTLTIAPSSTESLTIGASNDLVVNALTAAVSISAPIINNAGALTKTGSESLTLSSANTYGGGTFVHRGTLVVRNDNALGAGAVTLTGSGSLDLRNGELRTLNIGSTLNILGGAGANNLFFDLGAAAAGTDKIAATGAFSMETSGAGVININQFGGVATRADTNATGYDIITAASGLSAANFQLGTTKAFGQTFGLTSPNAQTLRLTTAQVTNATAAAFWAGGTASWNTAANWKDALAGSVLTVVPDYQTNVTFSATSATNLTTNVVDADFDINSLNFNATGGGVTIGGTKMLTIEAGTANGNTVIANNGINSPNTSGTNTINARVGLAASQKWTVGTGGTLAVGGVVSDFGAGYGITKSGAGTLQLTGTNTFSGGLTLSEGTVIVTSDANLGAASGQITFTANSTLQIGAATGVGTVTASRQINLNGGTATFNTVTGGSGSSFSTSGKVTGSGNIQLGPIPNGLTLTVSLNSTSNDFTGSVTIDAGGQGGSTTYLVNAASLADAPLSGNIRFGRTNTLALMTQQFNYTGTSDLTLNNRKIEFIGTSLFSNSVLSSTLAAINVNTDLVVANGANNKLTLDAPTGITSAFNGKLIDGSLQTLITKSGAGTWVLSGANTYTGVTTVSGGTLSISSIDVVANANPLGKSTTAAANLLLGNGTTLRYTGGAASTDRSFTINGANAGGESATLDASGTGAVNFTSTSSPAYGVTSAANTRTLILAGSNTDANTLAANIGNNNGNLVSLTKNGVGQWVLTGNSSYTGATTVNRGTLLLDYATNTSVVSSSSALTLGGGTLKLKGKTGAFTTAQTLASLSLAAGTGSSISLVPNSGTSTTLTITSTTIATGAGASMNFNLSGGTTNASTPTLGDTIVAWNPTLTSGIIGGSYTVTDLGGTGFAKVSAGNVVRLADPGSAGLSLTTGSSSTNYFINQNYSTSNTALAGSLVEALSAPVAANTVTVDTTGLASGAILTLGTNKLTLTIGGGMVFSGANPYTISGTTNGITSSGSGAITLNNYITSSSGLVISAPITNTTATAVTFAGTGTTRLSSVTSNYTGATTVTGGTLEVARIATGAAASSIGTPGTAATSLMLGNGTTLRFIGDGGTNDTTDRNWTLNGTSNGDSVTLDASGAGTETVTFSNTASPAYGVANQTRTINLAGTNTSANTLAANIANNGTGAVSLTKSGAGTWVLTGTTSSYTGSTAISNGILEVTANNALGTNAAGTTVADGATLRLTNVNYSTAEGLIINGTGVSGGALESSGTTTFAGQITAATSATINAISGTLELSGGLVKNGTTLTFTGAGAFTISSVISGALSNSDVVVDATTVTLNVANTYNGPTIITNGGTLIANITGALPLTPRSAVSFTGTGTSALNLGASQFVASLTSVGAATVALGSNTLTVGIAGGNTTFAGSINGTGGNLVKDTNSTQVLSGANGYTGTTTVSAGTLEVQGSLSGTTAVTVSTGGTLLMNSAASDIVKTTATVAMAGGTLAFGNAANQTQTLGAMTLTANSILDFGASGGADKFLFGALTSRTAGTTLTINNWLGNAGGGTDGTDDRLMFTGSGAAFEASFLQSEISFNGVNGFAAIQFGGQFEIVPVPEPATTALIGSIALCALVGYRERRRFTGLGKRTAARK